MPLRCEKCRTRQATDIGHRVAKALGGTLEHEGHVFLCSPCNKGEARRIAAASQRLKRDARARSRRPSKGEGSPSPGRSKGKGLPSTPESAPESTSPRVFGAASTPG